MSLSTDFKPGDLISKAEGDFTLQEKGGAVKFDGDKVRLELLPPEFLTSTASILTFGAQKYTKEFENEWERLCSVRGVGKVRLTTQEGSVDLVMKNNSKFWTLNMQNANGKTVAIGNNETQSELSFWQESGLLTQKLGPEIKQPSGEIIWQNMDLTNEGTMNFARWGARSAEVEDTYTLTIVMTRDNSEVSYVANATTVSECLEIIWTALKKHYNISKPLNKIEGDRNWEQGMDWSRVYGALQRHLNAWWGGEHTDPETGKSHLWHANCCMAFLTTYEIRNVGNDDRPVLDKEDNYEQAYTTSVPEQDGESYDCCGCCAKTESATENRRTY